MIKISPLRYPLSLFARKRAGAKRAADPKSIEVGRITFVFYQPDVDLCISWSTEIEAQLSDNVVSGGMDQRRRERDTRQ